MTIDFRRERITGVAAQMLLVARHEIVPVRGAETKIDDLPSGSTVTITSSPRFGITRTLEYAELLAGRGFEAVPHLAARDIADRAQLEDVIGRLTELGIRDVFVIGGDGERPRGEFPSAIELVEALRAHPRGPERIGVAAYPEGHPVIADSVLLDTLLRKQRSATYMTSQICFDPVVLGTWLRRMRGAGVTLPLRIGMPGALRRAKLLELSLKLGVGSSLRFVSKQRGFISGLARPGNYHPGAIVAGVAEWIDDADLRVAGFQVFTFNEVERTVAWERRVIAAG